jgi:sec-independent protein translocase protein TatB
MFGMSPWHLAVLVLVGLFVFGPERLPTMLRDLGKALRQVRATAQSMQDDLQSELGPEVGDLDLRSLHPRTFVEKHLFGDEEDPLGLDFLRGEDGGEAPIPEPVSFDKTAPTASVTRASADDAFAPPAGYDGTGVNGLNAGLNAGLNKVKYDLDAT